MVVAIRWGIRQTECRLPRTSLNFGGSLMTTYRRPTSRPLDILLVEDNPADVRLIQIVLEDAEFHVNFTVAEDGEKAMAMLRKEEDFANIPRPDMILLDLNLPKKDGREVLADLKDDPNLCRIPVVVLTTSQLQEDINYAYEMCANSYITKPVDVYEFDMKVRELLNYWSHVSLIPGG